VSLDEREAHRRELDKLLGVGGCQKTSGCVHGKLIYGLSGSDTNGKRSPRGLHGSQWSLQWHSNQFRPVVPYPVGDQSRGLLTSGLDFDWPAITWT